MARWVAMVSVVRAPPQWGRPGNRRGHDQGTGTAGMSVHAGSWASVSARFGGSCHDGATRRSGVFLTGHRVRGRGPSDASPCSHCFACGNEIPWATLPLRWWVGRCGFARARGPGRVAPGCGGRGSLRRRSPPKSVGPGRYVATVVLRGRQVNPARRGSGAASRALCCGHKERDGTRFSRSVPLWMVCAGKWLNASWSPRRVVGR
ncbi:hypothetical protein ADIAG_03969 [Paeniglutamicibacter gangotriensis Lz1y]|uniref:Uncharacterized protein n=1 Tax=Paeniglutamicibacter gangotriensis Lz1y TaxID=1276920 RepID=M7MKJ5_9MICC|nr:hypothetical protein ADIAG_03969 [Paeniglutamicibacter gangotriensis Lz1y]